MSCGLRDGHTNETRTVYQRSCCRAVNTEGVHARGHTHNDATDLCVWRGCREGVGTAMQAPSCEISIGPLGERKKVCQSAAFFYQQTRSLCLYFLPVYSLFSIFWPLFSHFSQISVSPSISKLSHRRQRWCCHRVHLFIHAYWGGGGVGGVIWGGLCVCLYYNEDIVHVKLDVM